MDRFGVGRRIAVALVAVATFVMAAPAPSPATPVTPEPAIVGGKAVSTANRAAQWSGLVGLTVRIGASVLRCGGSLVTDRVVLTAAHCLFDSNGVPATAAGITVTGGTTDLAAPGFTSGVAETWTHPGYRPALGPIGRHDIALLRLPAPVPEAPLVMASAGDRPDSGTGYVAGWGVHDVTTRALDSVLREAAVPLHTADYCNAGEDEPGLGPGVVDPAVQLCAGQYTGGQGGAPDTCQGDSGGPLVVRDRAGSRIVGLTSFGRRCGYYPAVYTAVGGLRPAVDALLAAWGSPAPPSPPLIGATGTFVPAPPVRVLDTRETGTRLAAGVPVAVPVLGRAGVPDTGVAAVALNVTAVEPDGDGYVTVFPCGVPPPLASALNYRAGTIVAAASAVGVGDGAVCALSYAGTDLVVDVAGWWLTPDAGAPAARFTAITPRRWVDTRDGPSRVVGGQVYSVDFTDLAPDLVGALTLNLTVVDPTGDGYVSVFPCGSAPPNASNLNYAAGQIAANAATVAVDATEEVCVTSHATTDLVIDVTGWFGTPAAATGARLTAIAPARLADTRTGPIPSGATEVMVPVAGRQGVPAGATAVAVTVTAVTPEADGYLSARPCGQGGPATSTVNTVAGVDVANLAFVPVGAGGAICVFTYAPAHIVVDVTGYLT